MIKGASFPTNITSQGSKIDIVLLGIWGFKEKKKKTT